MCSHYPGHDEGFYDTVKREAIYQIRRLAGHPALIAWCGNNENEMWYWDQMMPDHGLFHNLLPRLLAIEDGTRYYQPSSPFSPDGLAPNDNIAGDQHPWSVGFHDTDFRKYRQMICRFSDESGILGPNALPTVLECLPEGQRRVGSFAWMQHDNGVDCWPPAGAPDRMLTQWTGKDSHALGIPEAVYWMGLIQGEGLTALIDNFRRRMFSSAAAVFWMYNDCWPCTRSWTIVDYHRRRTPGFHPVRRAFATLRLVLTEADGEIQVWGVNDGPEPVVGEMRWGVFNLAGGFPFDKRQKVQLAANTATVLAVLPPGVWTDPLGQFPFASLEVAGRLVTRNRFYAPLFKELRWPKAEVNVQVVKGQAVFTAPVFVWGVCLDLDGEQPLADNFFDLWPGIPYSIPWSGSASPKVLFTGNLR